MGAPIEFPADGLRDDVVRLRLLDDADLPALIELADEPQTAKPPAGSA